MQLNWTFKNFDELTAAELYLIMQLRSEVFVVEQNCVYQDADGKDVQSWHLCGWKEDELVAYSRIIPQGISYAEASIGRVLIRQVYRSAGIGKMLMQQGIRHCYKQFNCTEIKIGAQVYLTGFYKSLGFLPCSAQYLEDGIPHLEMRLSK